ncbi:hypothetical protein LTR78_008334 [Recurvomyces mirabilis]|uniref:Uncharacterized protein n=1 Tax=Recurvomyces mirabilis TaxID=574656 RepID=A0AAE0WHR0_9PEZI|nr:hypothetical protein LTR78_008334 [Recurvomyces mirabilis]KAK5158539.1 hypothetical protein LTS14_003559 [Recurvomyces mirabilis]
MAFQQPQPQQRPTAQRQISLTKQDAAAQAPASPTRKRLIEESQEWILFSPKHDEQSHTSRTPRTATDVGSLETHVRSQQLGSAEEATCQGTEEDDDDAELDSLDDGLHAFQHHPFSSSSHQLDQSGGAVLPTHDGLGMFPSSTGLQEHLWQFERYNPHRRRHARRRSSIQRRLDEVEEEEEHDLVDERTARVEKWRLEQSKAVLEEIEREARRRQRRMSRLSGDVRSEVRESVKMRSHSVVEALRQAAPPAEQQPEQSGESWWQRLTRKVIQDLIGLDETTLSVIFGEQLAEDPSPTPTQPSPLTRAVKQESRVTFRDQEHGWEAKLMQRIAKELGMLVDQLSDHDAKAFSTYAHGQQELSYAGLEEEQPATTSRTIPQRKHRLSRTAAQPSASSDALFSPTLRRQSGDEPDSSVWGIEDDEPRAHERTAEEIAEGEYWERDVDVNMLFTYLRRRFSSSSPTPPPAQPQGPLPASWITSNATFALGTSLASMRRAEAIRRQHPLVSRAAERAAAQSRQRDSLLRRHQMQSLLLKRSAVDGDKMSSCASQSTKRSRHSRSGSSRHYWLEGSGSMGSGGQVMSSGLGGWGEV